MSAPGGLQEQQAQASLTAASSGALCQGSPLGTRSVPAATRSGPPRHQKLPSLSDVLDNRTDSGNLSTSHHGGVWGPCSGAGRSIIPADQAGPGGSPVSTASGYALSGPETDGLAIRSILSGNEARSIYEAAPSLQSQPVLEHAGYG